MKEVKEIMISVMNKIVIGVATVAMVVFVLSMYPNPTPEQLAAQQQILIKQNSARLELVAVTPEGCKIYWLPGIGSASVCR